MKMSGKIILLLLVIVNLFGSVTASVDKTNVIEGDSVTLSIVADGKNIVFPDIREIQGDKINGIESRQNISIINGNYKKTTTKTYIFTPSHSLTIPSYKVKIDGKEYFTNPIQIKLVKDKITNKNFKLNLFIKDKIIVNYPNLVTIKYYQKTNAKVSQIRLELPKGDFELKQIGKEKHYFEGVYEISELKYFLIPHKVGNIDFKVKIKLGFAKLVVDAFGFPMQQMRYRVLTKAKNVYANKIYNGLIGDFNISLKVDKHKIRANKTLNGELVIKGEGDLTNLNNIKFSIPNVTIYDNKPEIDTKIMNNKIYSVYKKNFVIIADNNYTIPPIQLKYFNIKTNKEEVVNTKSIDIEVINKQHKNIANFNSINNQTPNKEELNSNNLNYIYLILSFIGGVIFTLIFVKLFFFSKNRFQLPKNLYKKLLPYADNPQIKLILEKLYNNKKLLKEEKEFIKEFLKER